MTETMQTSLDEPSRALSGQGIARAAGLVTIGFIISSILGIVREQIIAALFGNGRLVDSYFAAARPPETIFAIVAGGALVSSFIPTFVSYLAKHDESEAWRMASGVVNLVTLALIGICTMMIILAEPIVHYALAPEFDHEAVILTASLMRIMMLTPIIFGLSGLVMGMLNANQRFLLPSIAPALYNIGRIIGALVLARFWGIYGLAWGMVLGAVLHLGVQLPGLLKLHPIYRPVLTLRDPGVREVIRLIGPRVLGLSIVQLNFWVEIILASGMVAGSISALNRAFTLLFVLIGVIGQSIGIAVFPTFARQVAAEDQSGLKETLSQVVRALLFLAIPATVGLVLLRLPIVRVIFEHGQFTFEDSQAVAWALLFYGMGLVFHALLEVVTRAFYALHDTRTPVYVGGGTMILNIVFSLILREIIGVPGSLVRGPFAGLALANTLATMIEVLTLLWLLRRRVGGIDLRVLGSGILRTGAACIGMAAVLWFGQPLFDALGLYAGLAAAILVGGVIFWGLAWMLGSEDARLFTSVALNRVRLKRSES